MSTMYHWVLWLVALLMVEINSNDIDEKVLDYFESDTSRAFYEDWHAQQSAMENAIQIGLTETYGYKGMNIFMKRRTDYGLLNKGYLHYDNEVYLLLLSMELDVLPNLRLPEVGFVLPNNVIQIESLMSNMILRCVYITFRNSSDIIYALKDQDTSKTSPFRFQQVEGIGSLAIIIEGCMLTGSVITMLSGESVILGHDTLRLSKCQYTIEIDSKLGSPPVIAKYNMKGEGLPFEHMLLQPIRSEMLPKLQAVLYNYVNTSAIFGDKLHQYLKNQEMIFSETSRSSDEFVTQYNKLTIEKNQGILRLPDFGLTWNEEIGISSSKSIIVLRKMVVTGLDTLYSAHIGGPYRNPAMNIGEELRFNILQVRGEIYINERDTNNLTTEFSVILHDVEVDVSFMVNDDSTRKLGGSRRQMASKSDKLFEVFSWRATEFVMQNEEYEPAVAFEVGYIQNALPQLLVEHLTDIYKDINNPPKSKSKKRGKKNCDTEDEVSSEKEHSGLIERVPSLAAEYYSPSTEVDRGRHSGQLTDDITDADQGTDTDNAELINLERTKVRKHLADAQEKVNSII